MRQLLFWVVVLAGLGGFVWKTWGPPPPKLAAPPAPAAASKRAAPEPREPAVYRDDEGDDETESLGDGASLNAIAGRAPDDAWAVGEGGVALHWDGRAWSPRGSAGMTHLEAGRPFADAATLAAVWPRAADDVWAVGAGGRVFRFDGK